MALHPTHRDGERYLDWLKAIAAELSTLENPWRFTLEYPGFLLHVQTDPDTSARRIPTLTISMGIDLQDGSTFEAQYARDDQYVGGWQIADPPPSPAALARLIHHQLMTANVED